MNAVVLANLRSLEALQAQIAAQNEISCLLREQLHDLRINRDAWRTHAEAAQHILVDGRPRRPGPDSKIGRVDALFKRCLLLILLAAVLLIPSNLIPVSQENIEAVFDCLLPAFHQLTLPAEKTGNSNLRFVAPAYTSEDRDYLIRTIAFEASGESEEGKAAVAHVILTRKRSGKWGDTIKEVVTHPWQFESWMTKRAEMESLDVEDYRYRSAAQIADAVLAGQIPDPTTGATHFLNPTVVSQRSKGSLPSWATGGGLSIGRHTFYAPDAVAWAARVTRPFVTSCWSAVPLLPN
jgi:N-acetylmuramoyl-L-alanine amidase